MLSTVRVYCALIFSSLTWPSPQSRGECRSAMPDDIDARRKLTVAAEWKYAITKRAGSGVLSLTSYPFRISPRKEGISLPSCISVGLDLGLANWPPIRAIRTTRLLAPQISTKLICSRSLIFDATAFSSQ